MIGCSPLQQTVNGVSLDYTLDLNRGLTQVLADGTNTYLYGLGRIGEQQPAGWQYHHGDALGSVRQLTDPAGAVTTTLAYEPFGSTLTSSGSASTNYAFTGEWADGTGLVHLRARYLDPAQGRFSQPDPWRGDSLRPQTLNPYSYVASNPILFRDPTGWVLDPSDPTSRGTIIHKMIQAQYATMYAVGGAVRIEMAIPFGSKAGLRRFVSDQGEVLYGTDKRTLATGFADIVDFSENGLYEIKPHSGRELGIVTVGWYISAWKSGVAAGTVQGPYLVPGAKYPRKPGVIVGSDPNDNSKWIVAELFYDAGRPSGVILYGTSTKDGQTRDIRVYLFEWDPAGQRVTTRTRSEALTAQTANATSYFEVPADAKESGLIGVCVAVAVFLAKEAAEAYICGPCALVLP